MNCRWDMQLFVVLVLILACVRNASAGETFPIDTIVPDTMPGKLELTVIPTPKQAVYQNTMIRAGKVALVTPTPSALRMAKGQMTELFGKDNVQIYRDISKVPQDVETVVLVGGPKRNSFAASFIKKLGLQLPADKGKEAYLLSVGVVDGRNVIVAAGNSPQADYWAIQSLRQVSYEKDGEVYVAEVNIIDWPTFELRGSKRPQFWESAFKANLRFENWLSASYPNYYMTEWIAGIHPMAPSNVLKVKNGILDVSPAGMEVVFARLRQLVKSGAVGIYLHVEDRPLRFTGGDFSNFESALHYFVDEFHKEMMRLDPELKLFFLPQPYYYRTRGHVPAFRGYAANLKAAGGLPAGTAITFNGHDVVSPMFPEHLVAQYREAFGALGSKAMLYDCCQERRRFRVVPKRPDSLSKQAFGIVQEQGDVVGRVTSYDWHWNPKAYDPDRSLKLLCRELAGLDSWKRVYDVLRLLEDITPKKYAPRGKLMEQYQKDVAEYNRKVKSLKAESNRVFRGRLKLPAKAPMAGMAFELAKSLPEIHFSEADRFVQQSFPELLSLETGDAPTIDGKSTEAVWRDAPAAIWGQDNRVRLRTCYDSEKVYFAMQWKGKVTPDYQFNLLLDPGHTTRQTMVFRVKASGDGEDEFFDDMHDSRPQGAEFKSGWKYASTVSDNLWTVELAVPIKDIRGRVKVADVWGVKVIFDTKKSGWLEKWGSGLAYLGMEGAGNLFFTGLRED